MPTIFQRRYERISFFAELEVTDLAHGRIFGARSIDVSRGGIGFFAKLFLPTGSRIRLTIVFRSGGQERRCVLPAVVMQAHSEGDGAVMGAAFECPLTPADQPLLCDLLDGK